MKFSGQKLFYYGLLLFILGAIALDREIALIGLIFITTSFCGEDKEPCK